MNINPIARFALSLLAPDSPWPFPSLSGFRRNEILGERRIALRSLPRSLGPGLPGGGRSGWTRTIDLGNNACVVSYPGARFCVPARIPDVSYPLLVGLDGLEPSTSRLSGARSNHLSYRPFYSFMAIRFESSFAKLSFGNGGDEGNLNLQFFSAISCLVEF